MSHDLHAAWAATELSRMFHQDPRGILPNSVNLTNHNIFSNREPGRKWPIPDGRISVTANNLSYEIAVEFKRENEGLHGLLTAIGQAEAYIYKGYSSSIIVIPRKYNDFSDPGPYIQSVLNSVGCAAQIGIYTYDYPDLTHASPFQGKISCVKSINLQNTQIIAGNYLKSNRAETQWAHLREGSTEAYAFFKYLQTAKQMIINSGGSISMANYPPELLAAVGRISQSNPLNYLSNSNGQSFLDETWRNFWFRMVLTPHVAIPWTSQHNMYKLQNNPSQLLLEDGKYKHFFGSRIDSIKNQLVMKLNSNKIGIAKAWESFAENVHNRAHSYREDIDSGLSHLGLLEDDGKPTNMGYNYVDACERTGDCFRGKGAMILGSAILKNGDLQAFLHYIYKLSEDVFRKDPLKFTTVSNGKYKFVKNDYLHYLRDELVNNLKVMNTSAARGGTSRQFFQGEFAILRKFDIIAGFRIGVGLEINWPTIEKFLEFASLTDC